MLSGGLFLCTGCTLRPALCGWACSCINFVQTPTMPKIEPAAHRAAITKYIAPNVLFWFRYSALATVVFGLSLALQKGYLVQALTFRSGYHAIGVGMWLALIMAFNVWFIIWPNQKKMLG